jgi:hypothetical protein
LLKRLLWVIEEGNTDKIDKASQQYFKIITIWNSNYYRNRNKIRLLVNDEMANYFLDYNDDGKNEKPKSIHYKFVVARRSGLAAQIHTVELETASKIVKELNWKCSVFLERLTTAFYIRAEKLDLLDVSNLNELSKD